MRARANQRKSTSDFMKVRRSEEQYNFKVTHCAVVARSAVVVARPTVAPSRRRARRTERRLEPSSRFARARSTLSMGWNALPTPPLIFVVAETNFGRSRRYDT